MKNITTLRLEELIDSRVVKAEKLLIQDLKTILGEKVKVVKELLPDLYCLSDYDDCLLFVLEDGQFILFYHDQDCCESVSIKDIDGNLKDLEDTLVMAEVVTDQEDDVTHGGSITWSFYKFATPKGYCTISWSGESNGYYSEEVTVAVLSSDFKSSKIMARGAYLTRW